MKAQELRIGNMILIDGQGVIVDNISEHGLNGHSWSDTHYGNQSCGFDYDYEFGKNRIEGIPITEKMVLKFGFELHDYLAEDDDFIIMDYKLTRNHESHYHNYTICSINPEEWQFILKTIFSEHPLLLSTIKYVHQLQNLYFALKNQELEIK